MTNSMMSIQKYSSDAIFNLASLWSREVSSNRKPHFVTTIFVHKRKSERWDNPYRLSGKQLTFQFHEVAHLANDIEDWYYATLRLLQENKVVPKSKIHKFMNFVAGTSALTASEVALYCDVSHDTAARWLNRADQKLNIFNRFTFGNKHYYFCIGTLRLVYETYLRHFDLPTQVDDNTPLFWELPKIEPDQNGDRRITDFKFAAPQEAPF